MNTYENYKDSGVPWIGEIPEHWNKIQITHAFAKISSGSTPNSSDVNYFDGTVPWLNTGDLNDGYIVSVKNYITENAIIKTSALTLHPENSIVVAMYGATIGKLGILTFSCYTNQACCVIYPATQILPKFFFYCLLSMRKYMISLSYGGGQPNISQGIIKKLFIPYLDICEQQAIANYLDEKTAKIDSLIAQKQSLIEKLEEKRHSIISEVVTKGLDPNATMKDSGIPWIGEIPEHWEISKMKYLAKKIGSGKTPLGGSESYENEGIMFLRSQNIHNTGLALSDVVYINEATHKKMLNSSVEYNDVLLNITGASIGRSSIYNISQTANVNQHVCIVRTKENLFLSKLINYYFMSNLGQTNISFLQTGANREGLNFDQLGNFTLLVPPLSEQQAIAEYLDHKTTQIDSLKADIALQIEKLKEYRKSLISEAVTGKIKVC